MILALFVVAVALLLGALSIAFLGTQIYLWRTSKDTILPSLFRRERAPFQHLGR